MSKKIIDRQGIYCIENITNGKLYIGSAVSFRKRWRCHRSDLNLNRHHSKHLQRSWNNNPTALAFKILEIVPDRNNLISREQSWIDIFETYNPSKGYNINPVAAAPPNCKGMHFVCSEEKKLKLSEAHKGIVSHYKTHHGFIDPNGNPVVIDNLKKFCRENNLDPVHMWELTTGKYRSHKGWTHVSEQSRTRINWRLKTYYDFVNPTTKEKVIITNLGEFCKEYGLSYGAMTKLIAGKQKAHKGWIYDAKEKAA
jgi:group I intron endonuclease